MLTFLEPLTESVSDDTAMTQPKNYSDIKPKLYLLGIAARVKDENESEKSKEKAQSAYQMCRRHRGETPNDNFGYWRANRWCEHPSYANLHSIPIFQSLIKGAFGSYVQAEFRLDVKANANNWRGRAVEKISKGIYEILNERQWTETAKEAMFYANILKNNAFFISRFDKSKGADILPVPEYEQITYEHGGMGICTECYAAGDFTASKDGQEGGEERQGEEQDRCPECGGTALSVIDEPQRIRDQIVKAFAAKKSGESEMVVADGFDVSVWGEKAAFADIKSCDGVEWRYFAQKAELKRLYPHLELKDRPDWSYQTRLKTALKRFEAGEAYPSTEFDRTNYEVRQIWLDLICYEDYEAAPEDFYLGKECILKRGESFKERYPDGMVMGVVNREIAFIDGENKNKRVSASLWLADGLSFEGVGAKAGLSIQRTVNVLNNVAIEGETRSLKGAIIYDPMAIDGAHLEGANTNIPLRTDFTSNGQSLSNFVLPLNVSGLSSETISYMGSQMDTMQKIMGIPDVTLGEDTSADKTARGLALRARSAGSLLIPATQSAARAKELWLSHQLDIIQKYYAPEALREFSTRYGEEWQEDEIQAFFEADLDRTISIYYVPGTEVPESRFDKQARLRQDIAAGFVQMTPALAAKLAEESGYSEISGGEYETNLKLAEKRFTYVKELIEPQAAQIDEMFEAYARRLTDKTTGLPATDETGNPLPNPAVMQFADLPELQLYKQAENHRQMTEYWTQKLRELAASQNNRSKVLIRICEIMAARHNQAIFELGMKAQTLTGLQQLPNAVGREVITDN